MIFLLSYISKSSPFLIRIKDADQYENLFNLHITSAILTYEIKMILHITTVQLKAGARIYH